MAQLPYHILGDPGLSPVLRVKKVMEAAFFVGAKS